MDLKRSFIDFLKFLQIEIPVILAIRMNVLDPR